MLDLEKGGGDPKLLDGAATVGGQVGAQLGVPLDHRAKIPWSHGREDEDAAAASKIRRRAYTWPLTVPPSPPRGRRKRKHVCSESCRFYSAMALLFYSFCILVVLTIFNVVFLSKLKYLSCTFATPWKIYFPKQ